MRFFSKKKEKSEDSLYKETQENTLKISLLTHQSQSLRNNIKSPIFSMFMPMPYTIFFLQAQAWCLLIAANSLKTKNEKLINKIEGDNNQVSSFRK